MASPISGLRKRRTRQHIIADLSVHYVEGFILNAGYTAERFGSDYGYDLLMTTFDENGYAEAGSVYFQLKAAEILRAVGAAYVYDLDIRDYHLWMQELMPVIFVLYDASRKKAYWLAVQRYFHEDPKCQPGKGAKSVRVRIPNRQTITPQGIQRIRELKQLMQQPQLGVLP